MRKLLISLLLASAAASPALAGPNDDNDRQAAREARQQAREDRQAAHENRSSNQSSNQSQSYGRPERPDRPDRSFAPQQQQQQQQGFERPAHQNFNNDAYQRNVEAYRARQQAVQTDRQADRQAERLDRVEQRADRLQQIRDNREARQANRFHPPVSDVPRPGTQPPLRVEQNRAPIQWSSNWRNNSKYDWKNWRHRHRSIFHLGFYYDPFGWGYNPFQIGWRMWPSYYSSRFWINDPWYYRLPYAPPGTRWVRYYDDAILVDMWTGEVVDVIYDFFW